MKKRSKYFYLIIIAIILNIGFSITLEIYTKDYYHANTSTEVLLKTDNVFSITKTNDFIKVSNGNRNNKGLIFYPGALVESSAYVKLARSIASNNIDVFIVNMPYNLAILKYNNAIDIIDGNKDINEWYLAGHSLGGAVISTNLNNKHVKGMILLGAYPIVRKLVDKPVLAIKGSNDKVISIENYNKYLKDVNDLSEVSIEGGNHAQFGEYGVQVGDGKAKISNEEQISITSKEIVKFIDKIK